MLVDVFGEAFHALLDGSIHGFFHVSESQHRRAINGSIWLLSLGGLLKEVHGSFEIIFRAPR